MNNASLTNGTGRRAAGAASGFVAATVAALAFVLTPANAWAQGQGHPLKPFAMVIETGAAFVHEPGFGHGLKYGVGFFFKTARRAAFEIVLERFEVPVDEGAGRDEAGLGGLTAGLMDMASVVFNQHIYVFTRGLVQPFVTIGVGFDFIGFAPDDRAVRPRQDIVDRLALQLGGGADLRITDRLALSGRARYNMAKTWVEILPRTGPIRDQDPRAQDMMHLYALELSVGIKVTF